MKILVIDAHNRQDSYCSALAAEYRRGALEAGCEVQTLNVREMNLDKYLRYGHSKPYVPEGDVEKAQKLIAWSQKMIYIYPTWWAGPPALIRLFFEMVLSPGFAFRYQEKTGMFVSWDKLLTGKSARIIATMDAPPWYYKWIIGDPGGKMMRKGILEFCGVKPVQTTYLGSLKTSSEEQRKRWLQEVYTLGVRERRS
jgi:NAD(P)H dehydrogenase (quinone)